LIGPWQFVPYFFRKIPNLHFVIGNVYVMLSDSFSIWARFKLEDILCFNFGSIVVVVIVEFPLIYILFLRQNQIYEQNSGQPIIKQVLNFIDSKDIHRTAKNHNSDRYTKKFTTYDHLVTMIFTVISGCSSLREVTSIMLACEGKINHLGLTSLSGVLCLMQTSEEAQKCLLISIIYFIIDHRFLSDSRTTEPAGLKSLTLQL
jgi:hypothetical protein